MSRRIPRMCLHRPSGRAYVTDPASRRQVPLGRWGSPEADAAYERWAAEFLSRPAGVPSPRHAAGCSVNRLCDAYLAHAEAYYVKHGKPTSEVNDCRRVVRVLADLYGREPAAAFTPGRLKAVRNAFVARGWSRGHVNAQTHRLRRVFRWGVEHELVPAAVLAALEAVAALKRGRTAAPEEEPVPPVPWPHVEATLPFLRPHWRSLVLVQYHGAMRAGDAVVMRPCDLDRSGPLWLYTPSTWKTEHLGKPRRIWLGPHAQAVLAPMLEHARALDGWVWRSRFAARRSHVTVDAYTRAIGKAAARAGVPHWFPLQLRHTALTEVRKRWGLDGAQTAGGHAHASVTEIYAAVDDDLARQIASQRG